MRRRRIPRADEFLGLAAGFTRTQQRQEGGSASRPNLHAVVDPAYSSASYPTTWPKVTFEGEDALTERTFPAVSPYIPAPGDRVVMLPTGTSGYVILGKLPAVS